MTQTAAYTVRPNARLDAGREQRIILCRYETLATGRIVTVAQDGRTIGNPKGYASTATASSAAIKALRADGFTYAGSDVAEPADRAAGFDWGVSGIFEAPAPVAAPEPVAAAAAVAETAADLFETETTATVYKVTIPGPDGGFWLRGTVWSFSPDRATPFTSEAAARAGLAAAKKFTKPAQFKTARVLPFTV